MENKNKKVDITQLTGSPSPTAVSEVAMGGKAETLYKHDDVYNTDWINRLKGGEMSGKSSPIHEIQEAYAKLFEGLAGLARCSQGCESECEHEEMDSGDQEPDDNDPKETQEQDD